MTALQKQILLAVVRWGLNVAGAYLVAQHVVTADQAEQARDGIALYLVEHGALVLPLMASLAWSLLNKYRSHLHLEAVKAS
jgi:hypothetical protein